MTAVFPRRAPLPRLSFPDWLRRELSPVLALLADVRHYLFAPLPPLPPIPVTFGMGTIPVNRADGPQPWGQVPMPVPAERRVTP